MSGIYTWTSLHLLVSILLLPKEVRCTWRREKQGERHSIKKKHLSGSPLKHHYHTSPCSTSPHLSLSQCAFVCVSVCVKFSLYASSHQREDEIITCDCEANVTHSLKTHTFSHRHTWPHTCTPTCRLKRLM